MSETRNVMMLPLTRLTVDMSISARAALPAETIETYTEVLRLGGEFPPVVAFSDGETVWIADGILRHAAYRAAGHSAMAVEVRAGGLREARLYAAGANTCHGLPRTSACRRLAVLHVLADDEGKTWTQERIASHCGVSIPLVRAVQALAKSAATPAEVVESKIGWTQGGKLPQAKAEVVASNEAMPSPAPNRVGPAPKPTPAPKPAPAPKPPTSANPWAGALDAPKKAEFVPSAKDIEEDDEGDADDADDADDDDAANAERLRRCLTKAERLALKLGMNFEQAVAWYREWQRDNPDFGTKHRRRKNSPPLPDFRTHGGGG